MPKRRLPSSNKVPIAELGMPLNHEAHTRLAGALMQGGQIWYRLRFCFENL